LTWKQSGSVNVNVFFVSLIPSIIYFVVFCWTWSLNVPILIQSFCRQVQVTKRGASGSGAGAQIFLSSPGINQQLNPLI
jgi:hypothetical protein